jgi:hypothetical protein
MQCAESGCRVEAVGGSNYCASHQPATQYMKKSRIVESEEQGIRRSVDDKDAD